jgi:nicotinate-nucleotide pyrophosphorylase (carboxylating)
MIGGIGAWPDDGGMESVRERVLSWLREDAADRDVTARALVPPTVAGNAEIRAKQDGVLAGLDIAREVFDALDAGVSVETFAADGDRVRVGQVVARVSGPCRALLAGERTALNILQRMSGVATHTAHFVDAVAGTRARIYVTRKTMPGLRDFDLAAVRAGGAEAHRDSLADRVLVKENHVAAAKADGWATSMADVAAHLVGADGPDVPIGIEVTDLDELREALIPGVDVLLVDNFTPALCREAVAIRDAAFPDGDGPQIEASGGITLETVRAFAEAGVERISTGAPTHSATALDLSMKIVPAPARDVEAKAGGTA